MSNLYAEKIEEIIKVAVGPEFAKSRCETICKMAGVDIEKISQEDLPVIAEKLQVSFGMLFGPSVGKSVAEKVKNLRPL